MIMRIFIAEDSKSSRGLMEEAFSVMGDFRVVGAASTEAEAIHWLLENAAQWDIAVLDLLLEQGSGIGILQRVQAARLPGKFVVFSGYVSDVIRAHCRRLGAAAVFDKSETLAFLEWLQHEAAAAHSAG